MSPSLVIAIAAVVLASAGSAVAARLITGKDIKNGTIGLADLSASARQQLSGARGPRGAEGPVGGQGLQGPGGPSGSPQAEPWKALTFAPGWTNWGEPWDTGAYRKDLASGRVDLRGLITYAAGSPTSTTPIATLPMGYRPKVGQIIAVTTGEPPGTGRIFVFPDGRVEWANGITGEKDYTSLSGISFWTD